MSKKYNYNTIEEALQDLREGKVILVTDDPDRENEGDFILQRRRTLTSWLYMEKVLSVRQ